VDRDVRTIALDDQGGAGADGEAKRPIGEQGGRQARLANPTDRRKAGSKHHIVTELRSESCCEVKRTRISQN
jgi:hypothetical protein